MKNKIIPILLLLILAVCQPYDEIHGGTVEGQILDQDGIPIEGVIVVPGYLRGYPEYEVVLEDTSYHLSERNRDTTGYSGFYESSTGMQYYSSSEPNRFGCSSGDAFTKLQSSFLGLIGSSGDTLIVLFSPFKSFEEDTSMYYHEYADTTIYLNTQIYEYYEYPRPFTAPDIIDHAGTL